MSGLDCQIRRDKCASCLTLIPYLRNGNKKRALPPCKFGEQRLCVPVNAVLRGAGGYVTAAALVAAAAHPAAHPAGQALAARVLAAQSPAVRNNPAVPAAATGTSTDGQ